MTDFRTKCFSCRITNSLRGDANVYRLLSWQTGTCRLEIPLIRDKNVQLGNPQDYGDMRLEIPKTVGTHTGWKSQRLYGYA